MTAGRFLLLVLVGGLLAACSGAPAILVQGDAKSAEVAYRGDLPSATAIARRHCARYERIPRLLGADLDTAYFDCVRP
jgi:hypothetical protein